MLGATNRPAIKAGDKIRCIEGEANGLHTGQIYAVTEVFSTSVWFFHLEGVRGKCSCDRFEPVKISNAQRMAKRMEELCLR